MDLPLILGIMLSLFFSFFFSGIEIAFLSANQLQIELRAKKSGPWGKIMLPFVKKPSQFIATTLIGNTLSLVIFGILIAYLIESTLMPLLPEAFQNEFYLMFLQIVISTLIILFLAEFLPKSLFLIDPDFMLAILAIPFKAMFYVLAPITFFITYLSKFIIVHVLKLEYSDKQPVFGLTDLNHYLNNMLMVKHEGTEVELNKKIFFNATKFKTVKVRECMRPRTEIVAVALNESIEKLKKTFIDSRHSKIIAYNTSIDDIIGYCHSSSLFDKPKSITDILIPPMIIPETIMARELMIQFIKERKSLAVVVDEFGGTSGIVSMEDLIEEIFGEIEDEHDDEGLIEQKIDDKTYILSARHEVDYLNEKYNWHLPQGDYETLGGMILSSTADFPKKGAMIIISPYAFVVQSAKDNHIETLKMTIID